MSQILRHARGQVGQHSPNSLAFKLFVELQFDVLSDSRALDFFWGFFPCLPLRRKSSKALQRYATRVTARVIEFDIL